MKVIAMAVTQPKIQVTGSVVNVESIVENASQTAIDCKGDVAFAKDQGDA